MKRSDTIAAALGTAPVAWLALKLAPYIQGGLPEILARLPEITDKPLDISLCPDSAKTLLAFLAAYGIEGKRMESVSYGKEAPKAEGESEEAYSQNRRANFRVNVRD